jgi:hypothetical protein
VVYTKHRDTYALIGSVVLPGLSGDLRSVDVLADGLVRITRLNNDAAWWQTYRWTGAALEPAGSEVPVPDAGRTQLSLATTQARSGRAVTIGLTIHNGGPAASEVLMLSVGGDIELAIRIGTSAAEPLPRTNCGTGRCTWEVAIEPVPPGASVRGTVVVMLPEVVAGPMDLHIWVWGRNAQLDRQFNADPSNEVTLTL